MTIGSTLLYGPPARRGRPVGLPARIGRLIRISGVEAAFAAFSEAAWDRPGGATVEPEVELAAEAIAAAQVSATYESDPLYTDVFFARNRGPEEEEMIRRQTTYLVLAGLSGNELPTDPRLHLYRWAERFEVLRDGPITRTLLPGGVAGRNVADYFKDLPGEHRRMMDELYLGEGSNLVGEAHRQLVDLLIDGDGHGFAGLQARLNLAKKALGYNGLPVPLLDFERDVFGRTMAEAFHPLPGSWYGLRKQVAMSGGMKMKIRRHLAARADHVKLAPDAADEDWKEIAVACLAYYDVEAEEALSGIGRRISRRNRSPSGGRG